MCSSDLFPSHDKRYEELGLNAVTLPKIADNNSAMKVAKELVDSGDVNHIQEAKQTQLFIWHC